MTSTAIGRSFLIMGTYILGSLLGSPETSNGNDEHSHSWRAPQQPPETTTPRTVAALRDQILDLPGLDYIPKFDMFAGYLDPVASRHVFYWYVESSNDPNNDPVVLWTNGGPGCSGLLGFGTEHGPFYFDRTGRPIRPNPYSWNRVANMLYVEIPAGVGFSYTDSPYDQITGDAQTSLDNFYVVLEFFRRFPERARNDFYIASESYGGHYIPQLALDILRRDYDRTINFKGFLLGNPYVDPYSNEVAQFEAYYSHGLIAKPLFDQWRNTCNDPVYYDSDECQDIIHDMFQPFGHGINPYALDFPVCTEKEELGFRRQLREGNRRHNSRRRDRDRHLKHSRHHSHSQDDDGVSDDGEFTTSSQVNFLLNQTIRDRSQPPFLPVQDRYSPCGQVYLEEYLNRHDVRAALHVIDVATYKWKPCGGIKYSEGDITTPVTSLYKELVHRAQHGLNDLKMLIFSGDDDAICSTAGTQQWIWNLGVEATEVWKPWTVRGQTAGFVTQFDLGPKATGSLSFATVHGAGHEVPAYRPQEALDLFHKFLTDDWQSLMNEWYLDWNEESIEV